MIKKAMNLVGVALLLASTILSPVSAVAQTLSNQSSTVTTQSSPKTGTTEQPTSPTESTQKAADTSSSQGQQPATENKAEANSNEQENKPSTSKEETSQVKEDTSSQKASKVEEKSETQPGAPPAAKDTKDTQAAPKTKRAAKEIDAITQFSITDKDGKPLNKPLQQWEQFKIDGQFKLPNNDVHEGDYTTFKISENLVLVSTPNFDIKDKDGQVVARATIDPENRLLKLTYTKYVENKSDVSGSFYFYTYVNHHIVKEKKKVPLQITVNRNIVPIGEVEFGGLTPPSQKDLTKVGNFKPDNTITYDITVNQSGKEVPDAKVTDILKTPNISYVKDSFEIYKGKWVIKDNRWVLENKKTVTNQFNVEFLSDSEFSIKLGKINKDEGYHIKYKAKANYKLQSGEVVENVASLWSSQTKIIDSIAKTTYLEAGGSAEGYVYSITLHKKDETSGSSLAGAVFRVTRDRNGAVVGDFTTDSTGKVTIPNLLKDKYTIKEIKAPDGYQLTGKEIKVKPENFNSSKSYSLDISNKRQKVSATLQVNKKLVGRKLKAQEFEFDLVDNTEVSPTVGKILQTVKNNANGEVNFKSLEYTKAGTYEYFIRENKGSAPGVTYDQKFITVTVEVKEKFGKLEVSKVTYMTDGEEIKNPTFNNRYTPVKTSAKLEVKKVLTGRPLQEGEFEFELKDLQRNKKILETVKNTADGKVQFKELKYTKAGIYHYTISEKAGDVPGVEYEPNLISATVTVEDKGGKLEVTKITYSKAGEETKNPTFENRYTPGKTFARLEVNKVLTGRQLQKDEFEFELKEDGKPDVLQTAKNDAQGKVQFQAINYDKAGDYHYTITEKNNGLTGVTYDSSEVKVTVKVTDDGKGKLSTTVTYDGGKKTFKNTFTPKEITVPLQVTKALTGRNLQDDEFEFELYEGQNKLLQTVKNKADGTIPFTALKFTKAGLYNYTIKEKDGKVPGVDYDKQPIKVTIRVQQEDDGQLIYNIVYLGLDESGKNKISKQSFTNKYTAKGTDATFSVTKKLTGRALKDGEFSFELKEDGKADVLQTKKNDKAGKVQFDAIKYQTVGTHKYTITEKNTGLGGVTYDTKTIKVTVEVTDNGKGQLVSKVTYENNDQTFNNTYSSQKVSAQLSVTKELTGRALNDQEFEFELVGTDDNVRQTKKNAANGRVTFDAIDYTKVGTYHYTIKEKDNGLGGVTYDKKEIKATVKVTDDGNGQLVAQVSYDTANPTFRNTYLAKETTATLEANKVLTGRDLEANEFAFDLIDPNGKVVETVKNAKDGKISFKELAFKTTGTYTYTIKEQAGALGGVKYDTKVIKATVTVTDDGKGQLHATVAYENNQNTFTNTYSADKATATLSAKKLLEGRNLKEGEFEFELTGTDDQVRQTKTNAQDGSVTFDTIEYTKVGTYHYTITEKDTKLGGVKYDTKVIKATVTVTDDGQGRLVTKVAYEKDDQTFKNTYSAAKTNAQLSVKKALTGRALKDGEFEFELKGQDDKVTQSKKNAQDGSVTFDTIEYTKAGTYHYTITEKNTKLQGITYDKRMIKVTVTVTDDGNGHLVAKVSYDKNIKTFENRYTPPKKGLPKTGTVIHTVAIFIGLIVLVGAVYLIKKKS